MLVLTPEIVRRIDLKDAADFVWFWSRFDCKFDPVVVDEETGEGLEEEIDYVKELNIGKSLTKENVKRLLRWKDAYEYTHIILHGSDRGQENDRVRRILDRLSILNKFRAGKINEEAFKTATGRMVLTGHSMRVFLFHITRPHEYPLADQNILRTFSCHTGTTVGGEVDFKRYWAVYKKYQLYFRNIANARDITLKKTPTRNYIECLTQIYSALRAFGKFLREYGEYDKAYFELWKHKIPPTNE